MTSALETYIAQFARWGDASVAETSYYGVLQALLNHVGERVKPRIIAVIHPKATGADSPDFALFDETQYGKQQPAFGVIEAKGIRQDLQSLAESEQVGKYLDHYNQVLVTNYYQFMLVIKDHGKRVFQERYDLARDEQTFRREAAHPRACADTHEEALSEYLLRVIRLQATLAAPKDVAHMLASYAREARARLRLSEKDTEALKQIKGQLEAALGVKFQAEKGKESPAEQEKAEAFFRSTLVQTLFYGVFAAFVLWHERRPTADAPHSTSGGTLATCKSPWWRNSFTSFLPLAISPPKWRKR